MELVITNVRNVKQIQPTVPSAKTQPIEFYPKAVDAWMGGSTTEPKIVNVNKKYSFIIINIFILFLLLLLLL